MIASTGDPAQAVIFAALAGKEGAGQYLSQPTGQLAVVAPASASVWAWTLTPLPSPAPAGRGASPEIWLGLAGLFGVSALLFGRARRGAPVASSRWRRPREAPLQRNVTVNIGATPAGGAAVDGEDGNAPDAGRRYHRFRPLPPPGPARRRRHGGHLHRRAPRRRGLSPCVRHQAPASGAAEDRSVVDQFIDEAKLGSSLVHTNIVPVFDFGKVGDEYFMAQEYISAETSRACCSATSSGQGARSTRS